MKEYKVNIKAIEQGTVEFIGSDKMTPEEIVEYATELESNGYATFKNHFIEVENVIEKPIEKPVEKGIFDEKKADLFSDIIATFFKIFGLRRGIERLEKEEYSVEDIKMYAKGECKEKLENYEIVECIFSKKPLEKKYTNEQIADALYQDIIDNITEDCPLDNDTVEKYFENRLEEYNVNIDVENVDKEYIQNLELEDDIETPIERKE